MSVRGSEPYRDMPTTDGLSQPSRNGDESQGEHEAVSPMQAVEIETTPAGATISYKASGRQQPSGVSWRSNQSASGRSSSVPSGDDSYTKEWVVLRVEFLSDNDARMLSFILRVVLLASLGTCLVLFGLKVTKANDWLVWNDDFVIANVVVASALLFALLLMSAFYFHRVFVGRRKKWALRRRKSVQYAIAKLVVGLWVVAFYLAPNIYQLSTECRWISRVVNWCGFSRWCGWNVIFLIFVMQAHNNLLVNGKGGSSEDVLILDQPIWSHLPLAPLWILFQVALVLTMVFSERVSTSGELRTEGGKCDLSQVDCDPGTRLSIATGLLLSLAVVYWIVYVALMFFAWRRLSARLYQDYRVGNIVLRLQVRFTMMAFSLFMLALILTWWVEQTNCTSYGLSWFGMAPAQLVMTTLILIDAWIFSPLSHNFRLPTSMLEQQRVAWTEQGVRSILRERARAHGLTGHALTASGSHALKQSGSQLERLQNLQPGLPASTDAASTRILGDGPSAAELQPAGSAAAVATKPATQLSPEQAEAEQAMAAVLEAPVFCMETAIKMFWFSVLIYDYSETIHSNFLGNDLEHMKDLQKAKDMYGLSSHKLLWDADREAKALIAWNHQTIIITFRGSATKANFIADASIMRIIYPEQQEARWWTRKSRTKVHKGFLATWQAFKVNTHRVPVGRDDDRQHVMSHNVVREVFTLLHAAEAEGTAMSAMRVFITGHSLGGALATLCAFDLRRALAQELSRHQVVVYTFGCPRVGNRAFSHLYEELVPRTWHIINDQDIVCRAMKVFGAYKHAGLRVVINQQGDLIVRPSFIEYTLLQRPLAGRIADHMLGSYQQALLQVEGQKQRQDGLEGVLLLLEAMPTIEDVLVQHHEGTRERIRTLLRTWDRGGERQDGADDAGRPGIRAMRPLWTRALAGAAMLTKMAPPAGADAPGTPRSSGSGSGDGSGAAAGRRSSPSAGGPAPTTNGSARCSSEASPGKAEAAAAGAQLRDGWASARHISLEMAEPEPELDDEQLSALPA